MHVCVCVCVCVRVRVCVHLSFQYCSLRSEVLWNQCTYLHLSSHSPRQVFGIDFSEDGSYFVTVGHRLVKFWYFKTQDKVSQPHWMAACIFQRIACPAH